METNINVANYNDILTSYNEYLANTSKTDNLVSFNEFLENNNLSTNHANEVYDIIKNNKPLLRKLYTKDEVKTRNKHPKAKSVLKWVGPVTALTVGVGVAGILGFAASTAVVGTEMLGMTMQANAAANALKVATVGFGTVGLPVGIATVGISKLATKVSLNKKYGNPKKAIKNNDLSTLDVDQLIKDIAKEKEEILNLRNGSKNIFSRMGRGILRTLKNVDNRIKTHKLEQMHNLLAAKAVEIINANLNDTDKRNAFEPYKEILSKINDFTYDQFKKSRVFLLLTCDDMSKKHTHKEILENEDILAEMQRNADSLAKIIGTTNESKKVKRDYKKANELAIDLLNDKTSVHNQGTESLLNKCLNRLVTPTPVTPLTTKPSVTIDSYFVVGNILTIKYSDGKTVNFNISNTNVTNVTLNTSSTYIIVTYNDGSTQKFPKNGEKLPSLQVTGAIKILENLQDPAFKNNLISLGNDSADVDFFEKDLTALIYTAKTKKVKAHARVFTSAEYNANPSYRKIVEDCNTLIKTASYSPAS